MNVDLRAYESQETVIDPETGRQFELRSITATATSGDKTYAHWTALPVDPDELTDRQMYELRRMTIDLALEGLRKSLIAA